MEPSKDELSKIAAQAEADLNSHSAKVGHQNTTDDAGVDSTVENKFPGAKVKYGADLSTNAGYNRRIPPEEGGELDDRGRQTRGEHFEGTGGPEDKIAQQQRDAGGHNDNDVIPKQPLGLSDVAGSGKERKGNDILDQGASTTTRNVGSNPPGPGGEKFKGEDYYRPESVPDSISAQGNIPPESVIEASHESETGS